MTKKGMGVVMQKNLSEKILYDTLGMELEDSEIIDARMEETYALIRGKRPCRSRVWKRVMVSLGSMAAVLCLMVIFCAMNPVLAKEIPILGSIFAKVSDVFTFGKIPEDETVALYSDGSPEEGTAPSRQSDTTEDISASHNEKDKNVYQKTDGDITVTLEQAYVSNQAIFVSVRVENEKAFPELAAFVDSGAQFLTLRTQENYSFRPEDPITTRRMVEGKLEDEHTFIGVMRIEFSELGVDLRRYEQAVERADAAGTEYPEYTEEWEDSYEVPASFDMTLNIEQIIGTLEHPTRPEGMKSDEELAQMTDAELGQYRNSLPREWVGFPNKYQHWYAEGMWDFAMPLAQRDEAARVIEVRKKNEDGIGIENIELSSVEMTVHLTSESQEQNVWEVIFDADGREIRLAHNTRGAHTITGHDISTVHIYLCSFEDESDMRAAYERDGNDKSFQELIKECAVFDTIVNIF